LQKERPPAPPKKEVEGQMQARSALKVLIKLFQKFAGCGRVAHGNGISFLQSFFLWACLVKEKSVKRQADTNDR